MSKQPEASVESMLVAYVDDQLDPAQRAAVEDILREDAEARAIVDVLRRSASAVRNAFDRPLHEPAPARLLAALGAAGSREASGNVTTLRPARRRAWPSIAPLAALAASIAMLFAGVGVGYLRFAPEKSIRLAGTDSSPFEISLYRALEQDAPGGRVAYTDASGGRSGAVTVVGPVATSLGISCREFRNEWKDVGGNGMEDGIACRSTSGEWSVLTVPHEPAS